jgi:hypothetical protein
MGHLLKLKLDHLSVLFRTMPELLSNLAQVETKRITVNRLQMLQAKEHLIKAEAGKPLEAVVLVR